MAIIIKQLPKKDIIKVKGLITKLRLYEGENFDKFLPIDKKGLNANFKHTKKEFNEHKGVLFVALDNSEIIGYSLGWIKPKDNFCTKKAGILNDIFVEENYRNKGIGEMLAKALLKWFKANNIKLVNIYAYSINPSIKLYRRIGFKDYFTALRKEL